MTPHLTCAEKSLTYRKLSAVSATIQPGSVPERLKIPMFQAFHLSFGPCKSEHRAAKRDTQTTGKRFSNTSSLRVSRGIVDAKFQQSFHAISYPYNTFRHNHGGDSPVIEHR